jgi:agmatinase
MSQQSAFEYLRHGQTPFFRLPTSAAGGADSYLGYHAVLLGVTYDGGTTYQPGARLAPFHVRRVSALVQSYHRGHGLDVFGVLRAVDGGNVAIPPFDAAGVRAAIEREVAEVVSARAVPFLVGGDHSISLPALRAVAGAHGPLAVVHVDAHLDTSGPETWAEPFHHGSPIRHALEEGLIARGQLYQVGLRATWASKSDGDLARAHAARHYTIDDLAARGAFAVAQEIRTGVGDRPLYLTFDVDALDPAFAPGTGTPVPGGMTSREALALVKGLAGARVVGMDVVEIAPGLDHADITSHLGAALLFEGLALAALARR